MYEAAVSIAKLRNSMGQRKFIDSVIKTLQNRNRSIDMNGKQKYVIVQPNTVPVM